MPLFSPKHFVGFLMQWLNYQTLGNALLFSHGDVSIRFNGDNDNVVLEYMITTLRENNSITLGNCILRGCFIYM